MRSPPLNAVKHMLAQMLNEESDAHVDLINKLKERAPSGLDDILNRLDVVHSTRNKLLEQIIAKLKEL